MVSLASAQERVLQGPCVTPVLCCQLLEAIEQGSGERQRRRRQTERLKPYVAAQVDVLPETFTLGDKKNYQGFYNRPLSLPWKYQAWSSGEGAATCVVLKACLCPEECLSQ